MDCEFLDRHWKFFGAADGRQQVTWWIIWIKMEFFSELFGCNSPFISCSKWMKKFASLRLAIVLSRNTRVHHLINALFISPFGRQLSQAEILQSVCYCTQDWLNAKCRNNQSLIVWLHISSVPPIGMNRAFSRIYDWVSDTDIRKTNIHRWAPVACNQFTFSFICFSLWVAVCVLMNKVPWYLFSIGFNRFLH